MDELRFARSIKSFAEGSDRSSDIIHVATGYKFEDDELKFILGNQFYYKLPQDKDKFLKRVNDRLQQLKPRFFRSDSDLCCV